jgi:hypothetical protein
MRRLMTSLIAACCWLAATQLSAQQYYHDVFVTSFGCRPTPSTLYPPNPGDFNGLAGADYNATFAADEAGMINNWNGTDIVWHAILSSDHREHTGDPNVVINARDRLDIEGPIYNMAGQLVATDAADLWDGTVANPINYDEFGNPVPMFTKVWTGSFSNGASHFGASGNGWTANSGVGECGYVGYTNSNWIEGTSIVVNQFARLSLRLQSGAIGSGAADERGFQSRFESGCHRHFGDGAGAGRFERL